MEINGDPSNSVTVASPAPLPQTLTLALPIQTPGPTRDDFWSESSTSALIDAWSDRFLLLRRGNLNHHHWQEIAAAVSRRDHRTNPPKSHLQCKNRIDTLKKKYKIEKSKPSSSWIFFNRLDFLLGPIIKTPGAAAALPRFPQKQRTKKRKVSLPPPPASSSSDSLPARRRGGGAAGLRELARAVLRFGEVYQRVETSKLQRAMEMEKQRIGFVRELEMQRMQFFMKTQMELSQLEGNNFLQQQSGRNGNKNGISG